MNQRQKIMIVTECFFASSGRFSILSRRQFRWCGAAKAWHKKQVKAYNKAVARAKAEGNSLPAPLDPKKKAPQKTFRWNLTMTSADVIRITKNFAFMARSLHELPSNEAMLKCGRCCIEHHFDNHEDCRDWCQRKKQSPEERKQHDHFYRCKTKDSELYAELTRIMARFITLEALLEVAHNMDTLVNESLNNTIAWIAPKNKVYCGTKSLSIRIAIAVGITSLGTLQFYTDLFRVLGIKMTADVAHWLQVRDGTRSRRIAKTKTPEAKRRRLKSKYDKLAEETKVAKEERAKREGTYEPGIGLAGGYAEEDTAASTTRTATTPTKKNAAAAIDETKTCIHCGQLGHLRKSNRLCRYYVPPQRRAKKTTVAVASGVAVATEPGFLNDAEEAAAMDAMPLEDSSGDDAYFDATGEYSSDGSSSNGKRKSCII